MVVWGRGPNAQHLPAPRSSVPLIRTVTPPKSTLALLPAPSPPASAPSPGPWPRVELVSVVEGVNGSPIGSRTSETGGKGRRSRDEVYVERERETVRLDPGPRPVEELERYRYVKAPNRDARVSEERARRRSINYETTPRMLSRTVERKRERVVIEDGGKRRYYYPEA
jgi:hypothetical protein